VPDARRPGTLEAWPTAQRVAVLAVGLPALRDVVGPAHMVTVEEVGQVGPRVQRAVRMKLASGLRPVARAVEVARARSRIRPALALRRPSGNGEEVSRETPAVVGLEHVVLQDRSEEHTSELQSRSDLVC